ncbi:unnamed protein product, partial [Rotaria sordida]
MESSNQIEKFQFSNQLDIKEQISQKWIKLLGSNYEIQISDIYKPPDGRLGISLHSVSYFGHDDEIYTHNYIHTVLSDEIVGLDGKLKRGDELLEVNNKILYRKDDTYVIKILKSVKHQIKLVCARRKIQQFNEINPKTNPKRSRSTSFDKTTEIVHKAKSTQ